MLTAAAYQVVYLLLVAFMTVWLTRQYATFDFMGVDKGYATNNKTALIFTVFLMFFIGFRPLNYVFVDMMNYADEYNALWKGKPYEFTWDTDNFIFDNLFHYWGSAMIPIDEFFLLIAVIYFGGIFFACRKMFPDDLLLTFLIYLGAFSTFSYGTNGIKAGAAASLFLIAIAYREKKMVAALFLFLSLGFHHSMVVCLAAFLLPYFVKDRKYYLYGWIACFVMAALGIASLMSFFGGFVDDSGAGYLSLNQADKMVSGFRPDFILYSAIPIFLGDYLVRRFGIESEEYDYIWKVYVAANAVFLICTYGSYINRIAYLSWLMYPIVLIYPFLHCNLGEKQYTYLKYAVYGHLGFTMFMSFVYYGI